MSSCESRDIHLKESLGEALVEKIHSTKVLVVGAGGIGCELLKNLAMTGFLSIEVIDLDTVDVSNLNRQFLFRKEHVGMSKAKIAADTVKKFNPSVDIVAHHGNVKSSQFGLNFISKFDIVFNALDNVDARRHVNRLCIAKKKPLIESGTAGYLGQVFVVKAAETECYECQPKPTPKTYPICTIRSTPDRPVHCIVWAKELFKLVFGNSSDSMLFDDVTEKQSNEYMSIISQRDSISSPEQAINFAIQLLVSQFNAEIRTNIGMNKYAGSKHSPTPLDPDMLMQVASETESAPTFRKSTCWENNTWTLEENVREFSLCILQVFESSVHRSSIGSMVFDKDDKMAMRFVTAASNLRSLVFQIPLQSFHDAQGIAGNIIPAIATTNAIIAGLQVAEALKLIQNIECVSAKGRYVYCLRESTRKGLLLQPVKLMKPNEKCFVCGGRRVEVSIDTGEFTLESFIKQVLKMKLGFNAPSISIGENIIYEEGDGSCECLQNNLPTLLQKLPGGGICDGTIINIEDYTQHFELIVHIYHKVFDESQADRFSISNDSYLLATAKGTATPTPAEPNPEDKSAQSYIDIDFDPVELQHVDDICIDEILISSKRKKMESNDTETYKKISKQYI